MIIVGSKALQQYDMNRRQPKDTDVWLSSIEKALAGHDCVVMPDHILKLVHVGCDGYATPDAIYTIKCSHLGWDIHWEKTKRDILWLKHKGCELVPELYDALVAHWKMVKGNKDFLSLDQASKDFFNDHVNYIYDHDYLHELAAFPNRPMYTRCLKDGQQVLIDKKKFDNLDYSDRVRLFREEITVIAVERWVIPKHYTFLEAYGKSLKKTVTRLTKNWACDFICTNLDMFYKPDMKIYSHISKTLGI